MKFAKIKLPKGWKLLQKGTTIEEGDRCIWHGATDIFPLKLARRSISSDWWVSSSIGQTVGYNPTLRYARKIKK